MENGAYPERVRPRSGPLGFTGRRPPRAPAAGPGDEVLTTASTFVVPVTGPSRAGDEGGAGLGRQHVGTAHGDGAKPWLAGDPLRGVGRGDARAIAWRFGQTVAFCSP